MRLFAVEDISRGHRLTSREAVRPAHAACNDDTLRKHDLAADGLNAGQAEHD